MSFIISHPTGILNGPIGLPLSKSESNRILTLQALSNGIVGVEHVSDARDTKLLQEALRSDASEINVKDAGTTMRFLTAYYCATNQHKILTGSDRMCERPIGILVDALREIGFDVKYLNKDGFPPLEILFCDHSQLKNEVHIAGNISSQYISALAMIAPTLPNGLEIHFTSTISSRPYIDMTIALLAKAGIHSSWLENSIHIAHQDFQESIIEPSADWSAASYWFSMAALCQKADITLKDLTFESAQGDKMIAEWCEKLGVEVTSGHDGLILSAVDSENQIDNNNLINPGLHFDFTDNPDLAQTMIVLCAAKNINATFTGLQSLRIKETDRIAALQIELLKFGVKLEDGGDEVFHLGGTFAMSEQVVSTYNDHRMAMAFAPLALLGKISIEDPDVVVKSYPNFWKEMVSVGFEITSNTPQ
jgi:3-phosphoshikimate 1-carboxyvinyltransferase